MLSGRSWVLAVCFVGVCGVSSFCGAQETTTAIEKFEHLRAEARAARESGNREARLQAVGKIRSFLNDSPAAVQTAAQVYADTGDTEHALAALRQLTEMGQVDDGLLHGKNKVFAAMDKLPEYQSILKRFAENETAVSRAETAFALSDPGLVAEDIDYDRKSDSFLITSILENRIIRITPEGKAKDFAQSPSHWPMLAIKVDAARNRVWATEVAIDRFTAVGKSDWGRSAVLCFDRETGALRSRVEGPAHSALGDMVLDQSGNPIVSDGDGGGVYRVSGNRLERIDGGEFISPQTPAMHPDEKHVFVPDYVRGIGVLDLASKQTTWLGVGTPARYALSGIDGLYFEGGSLTATQNGTSPERVVRFELNSTLTEVVSEQIIERETSTLGDPTHGAVVRDFFYYIANSGWSELNEHGDLKAGSKLTPARIMRFRLRTSTGKKSENRMAPLRANKTFSPGCQHLDQPPPCCSYCSRMKLSVMPAM